MTVAELIEALQAYSPDMEVYAGGSGGEYPAEATVELQTCARDTGYMGPRGGFHLLSTEDVLVITNRADYPERKIVPTPCR